MATYVAVRDDVWSMDKAVEAFMAEKFEDGHIVSHVWFEYALNLPVPKTLAEADAARWVAVDRMDSFRQRLLTEHQICLANVRGHGYKIVPPNMQARYALEKTTAAVKRELHKGSEIIKHTRMDALNINERRKHTDATNRLDAISTHMKRERRNVLQLLHPAKT